jgi:uncharacterized protein YbaR (Trm112 family)
MGHRQKMTPKERLEFDSMSYKRMLEAKKGTSHTYGTDEVLAHLEKNGYKELDLMGLTNRLNLSMAKEIEKKLRETGHYARVIAHANKIRIPDYTVYYKARLVPAKYCTSTWYYLGYLIEKGVNFGHVFHAVYRIREGIPVFIERKKTIKDAKEFIQQHINQ